MLKMRISPEEAMKYLKCIEHEKCQKGIESNWKVENGQVKPQSACWLYCWGKPNTSSPNAEADARMAFNKIFEISYIDFDKVVDHTWARKARYSNNTGEVEAVLKSLGIT